MKKILSRSITPDIQNLLALATSEARVYEEYRKYTTLKERELYGLDKKGEILGCIGILLLNSSECEIKHIAVALNERGNGIGTRMIDFIREKYPNLTLIAETDKDAVHFYKKYGFKITSLGEKYPGVERFFCKYE